jgi:putative MFS transporter
MALTPDRDWIFLTIFRFFVGFGVSGLFTVDTTLVQEYVPASKRGWVGGVVTSWLPLGLTLGTVLGRFLTPYRVAWSFRRWAVAGAADSADPRLGSRIVAVAAAHGAF